MHKIPLAMIPTNRPVLRPVAVLAEPKAPIVEVGAFVGELVSVHAVDPGSEANWPIKALQTLQLEQPGVDEYWLIGQRLQPVDPIGAFE